jgi:hypothetical protein
MSHETVFLTSIVSLSVCVSLRSLLDEVELLYGALFCHGSLEVARTSLHTKASLRLQVQAHKHIYIVYICIYVYTSYVYTVHSVSNIVLLLKQSATPLPFFPQDAFSYGFGVRVGVALVLLAWVLWDTFVDDSLGQDVWHDPAFKVRCFSIRVCRQ